MCTFFVFAAQMFSFIFRFSFVDDFHNDGEKENYIEALALYGTVFVVFIAGLISSIFICRSKGWKSKRVVLYITESAFLAYILVEGIRFSHAFQEFIRTYNSGGWLSGLVLQHLPVFLALFFMNLPFAQTLEIIALTFTTFMIIIPLDKDAWIYSYQKVKDSFAMRGIECDDDPSNLVDACKLAITWEYYVTPTITICVVSVAIVIVSFFVSKSNRKAFVNKKIIEAFTKQREETLMKQKKESESLLYSIFPKPVARELMRSQSETEKAPESFQSSLRSLGSSHATKTFGRTVARMHHNITILFTDIVGFTSMSQSCSPYSVMHFLHLLFTDFDTLVDMDSCLWKVETIGDAFMVASGLGLYNDAMDDDDDDEHNSDSHKYSKTTAGRETSQSQ